MRERWATVVIAASLLFGLVLPAMGQQNPFGTTGSFLNGPQPITFKPIDTSKAVQSVKPPSNVITPAAPRSTGFFSRVYPKISFGTWPPKFGQSTTPKTPQLGPVLGK